MLEVTVLSSHKLPYRESRKEFSNIIYLLNLYSFGSAGLWKPSLSSKRHSELHLPSTKEKNTPRTEGRTRDARLGD